MRENPYQDMLEQAYPNPEIEKAFPDKVLRAAQFAPFAALTGHDAAVAETARLTERRQELNEDVKAELDYRVTILREAGGEEREVTVTYFLPDEKKEGGAYLEYTGQVVGVKDLERKLVFLDGTELPMDDIVGIEGKLFEDLQE